MGQQFISHFGILGMKWGVRRYQNKDGSLTPAGKKRVSKQYEKAMVNVIKNYAKKDSEVWLDAYNKTAEVLNNGETDKYNESSRKKYGENYGFDPRYESGYEAMQQKLMDRFTAERQYEIINSDPNFIKAQALIKKYEMTKWDSLAKENVEQLAKAQKMWGSHTKPTKKAEKPLSEKTQREIESSKKYLEKRPDLMVVYDKKYDVISYASKKKANRKLDIDYSDSSRYAIYE